MSNQVGQKNYLNCFCLCEVRACALSRPMLTATPLIWPKDAPHKNCNCEIASSCELTFDVWGQQGNVSCESLLDTMLHLENGCIIVALPARSCSTSSSMHCLLCYLCLCARIGMTRQFTYVEVSFNCLKDI
jgi:hypothetical protein